MATFESARIQTAARAVGVAQSALGASDFVTRSTESSSASLSSRSRASLTSSVAWPARSWQRVLTVHAAREKDSDRRCDIEAGMAKLLAAWVAWASVDDAMQIHGGNGWCVGVSDQPRAL